MQGREAETRDRQPLEDGRRETLERLRAFAAATLGDERMAEAPVQEVLEASARAVWLVGSEALEPMGTEPHRND